MSASRPRLWLGAFTGFYKPGIQDVLSLDAVSRFLYAARSVILVISAQGKLLGSIQFPEVPANCAWGDPDGKTLYVTARTGLYRIRTNVAGIRP